MVQEVDMRLKVGIKHVGDGLQDGHMHCIWIQSTITGAVNSVGRAGISYCSREEDV